ncbi:MAG: helix-turn-helix domain-containing protein [Clostridiales bacterium]|nr:helix-turn-helix domain-containing protein [Clostridiales bacterium]MDY5513758.1 helix-turn-helix domain-containing protein [Candidatus Ventricola sp.]
MSDNRFMTVAEVRKVLSISKNSAYTLVSRSDFPSFRAGKVIRIPVKQFEEWVDRQVKSGQIVG